MTNAKHLSSCYTRIGWINISKVITMQTQIDKQVILRFFDAIDALVVRKCIESVQSYCSAYGFDSRNIYALRKPNPTHSLHFDCLMPLIMTYGVSPLWLTTGLGDMFMPMYRPSEKEA